MVVVGAGLEGSTTAYHLARRGSNKVLLLEQVRQLYKGTYTHTVHEKQHALVIISLCLPLDRYRYELRKLCVALFNIHYLYNFACFSSRGNRTPGSRA